MEASRPQSTHTERFVALSLLVHLLLLLVLPELGLHTPEEPEPIELSFIERPKPKLPAPTTPPPERGKLVEVPIENPVAEPVDSEFLSEANQRVDKDTWRPDPMNDPRTRPGPKASGKDAAQQRQPAPPTPAVAPQPRQQPAKQRMAKLTEPAVSEPDVKRYSEGEWMRSREKSEQERKREAEEALEKPSKGAPSLAQILPTSTQLARLDPAGGGNEFLPELEHGERTRVSTREFKHYSYYVKLREKIRLNWDFPREGRGKDGKVAVLIVINSDGTLRNAALRASSGFEPFDEEAVEAVRLGAPFDPLPKDLQDETGRLALTFTFHYLGGRIFRVR